MTFKIGDRVRFILDSDQGYIYSLADGGYMVRFDYGGIVYIETRFLVLI